MNLLKTEPAVVIGLVITILVEALQQVLGSGIVTNAGAIQWLNLIVGLLPLLGGLITRSQVFSPATVASMTVPNAAPSTTTTADPTAGG